MEMGNKLWHASLLMLLTAGVSAPGYSAQFFLSDGKSNVGLADDGKIASSLSYDAYGKKLALSDARTALTTSTTDTTTNFTYNQEYQDPSTGEVYLRSRDFDAQDTKRFSTRDTDIKQWNRYAYMNGAANPVAFVDPSGHDVEKINYATQGTMLGVSSLFGINSVGKFFQYALTKSEKLEVGAEMASEGFIMASAIILLVGPANDHQTFSDASNAGWDKAMKVVSHPAVAFTVPSLPILLKFRPRRVLIKYDENEVEVGLKWLWRFNRKTMTMEEFYGKFNQGYISEVYAKGNDAFANAELDGGWLYKNIEANVVPHDAGPGFEVTGIKYTEAMANRGEYSLANKGDRSGVIWKSVKRLFGRNKNDINQKLSNLDRNLLNGDDAPLLESAIKVAEDVV
ncbi:MAG: RHS repeat-associated core domain-containing protein [Francisellaceae bacterium]